MEGERTNLELVKVDSLGGGVSFCKPRAIDDCREVGNESNER